MISSRKNRLLTIVGLLLSLGALEAKADIFTICQVDLGKAGRTKSWALFSLGGGINDSSDASGSSAIIGDVGVAGNGNINISGGAAIYGDLWYHTGGLYKNSSKGHKPGNAYSDAEHDTTLEQGVIDAMNASTFANNKPNMGPSGLTSLNNFETGKNTAWDIRGQGCVVLHLNNFKLSGGTLTLTGTTTDAIIINVASTLSLQGSSRFVLSGGITWDNVLFNVVGRGSDVALGGSSYLEGIVLATQRKVAISGVGVRGEVIGNQITLSGSARVENPSQVSN